MLTYIYDTHEREKRANTNLNCFEIEAFKNTSKFIITFEKAIEI